MSDFKVRVREDKLRELLAQSVKKFIFEQSKIKDSITSPQKAIIAQIANWLSVDCTDRHRWVMLVGGVGNGKSTVLKAMHYLIHWLSTTEGGIYQDGVNHSYCYITAFDLCELYKEDRQSYNEIKNRHYIFLDDMGAEPQMQIDWGNEQHPIKELLMYRYNRQLPVIISSNIPKAKPGERSQYEIRYTLQVSDRLNEMCMTVAFNEKSFR